MIRIREAVVVEGRYDVNAVRQMIDTVVLETGGFRIFRDADRLRLLRRIASARGLIILTDSDGAGFVIRNYLKGALPRDWIKQAYIPDIAGKERRKAHPSRAGTLGVEGMRPEVLIDALRRAGATFLEEQPLPSEKRRPITKADFYDWGLAGQPDSAARRRALQQALDLPAGMTANALLEFINCVASYEEVKKILMPFMKAD